MNRYRSLPATVYRAEHRLEVVTAYRRDEGTTLADIARSYGIHAWVGTQRLMLALRNVEGAREEGDAIVSMLEALELKGPIGGSANLTARSA